MNKLSRSLVLLLFGVMTVRLHADSATTAAAELKQNFDYINNKVLAMAEDFPEDRYDFKLKPEMRSFRAVIVHIAAGNTYAGKAGKGANVKWDDQEQDVAKFKTKADCVSMFKQSIAEANAAIQVNPEGPSKNLEPFLAVLQHSSEHYGLLVAYYRANGLVPPESRPKK
jgi:nitrogen fixation/metabolism regulation signal transduction histidine kinase